jgi:hypothetical protein
VVNRGHITVDAWPLPYTVESPLFLVVLMSLLFGFVSGAIVVWLAAGKTRRALRAKTREAEVLDRQARELKADLDRRAAPAARPAPLPVPADAA